MKIPPELHAAWNNVRDDHSTANWMVCEPNSNGSEAFLVAKGKNGWSDFISHFTDDKIRFGGCRCRAIDDRGTTKSVRAKFIMVSWQGKKVSAVQRAKAGTLQAEFKKIFDGCHLSIQTNDPEDFSTKNVERSLQSNTGAHKPTGYEFGGNEGIEGLVDKEDGAAVGSGGGGGDKSPRSPGSPRARANVGDAQGGAKEAWAAVRSDMNPLNWIMLGYDGKDLSTVHVAKKGYGGLEEFCAAFEEDKVLFGGYRCKAYDDKGSVRSVRAKFVFVSYVGPKVKPTIRAQVSTHKSHFEKLLEGCVLSLQASDCSDLTEKEMVKSLNASTGAHKPTGYDFGGATEEEIAAYKAGAAGPGGHADAAAGAAPAEKPAAEQPAEKPAEDKPAEDKPAEEKPAEEKPAEEKPAEEKPAEDAPPPDCKPPEEEVPTEGAPPEE